MVKPIPRRVRPIDVLGLLCVAALFLLTSWVDVVRAEGSDEALMSVDPALVAEPAPAPEPSPAPAAEAPHVVQLNTRGYNYGPPPGEIDREAARFEGVGPPAVPAPR